VKTWLYYFGKPRDARLNALAAEFVQRADRLAPVKMVEATWGRFDPWTRHPAGRVILLDPGGKAVDSAAVAKTLRAADETGRELVFVVGPHHGYTPEWRQRAHELWSLSPLTFSHEIARLLLAEQIFRAWATLRNHPYVR